MKNQKKSAGVKAKSSVTKTATKPQRAEKPAEKADKVDKSADAAGSEYTLTPKERSVLGVFCRYRMTAGYMLCFSGPELATHSTALGHLVRKGLLLQERFRGGYQLTAFGYEMMQAIYLPGEAVS